MELPPARTLGRAAAALSLGSAVTHVALLDGGSTASLAMTAMALACLPCAWHLWRRPTPGVWGLTAAVDAGMLAVHGQMVAGTSSAPAGTATMPGMAGGHGSAWLVWLALVLVGAQLVIAAAATVPLRRGETPATRRSSGTLPVHRIGRPEAERR